MKIVFDNKTKEAVEALDKIKSKKKYSKKYTNMIDKYRKLLVNNAMETAPYDQCWMLESLILNIKFMKEYYHNGENVMAMENKDWDSRKKNYPTREEICDQLLNAYDNWQNIEDKYIIHHSTGGKKNGKGIVTYTRQKDGTEKANPRTDWWIEYKLGDSKETWKVICKESAANKKLFFKLLEKYIDELWD